MIDADASISSPQTIAYATPAPRSGPRLAAAVWIAIVGLVLIALGGSFLIGVMVVFSPSLIFSGTFQPVAMKPSTEIFVVVLYALAFSCFGGAIALLLKGLRSLFKFAGGTW